MPPGQIVPNWLLWKFWLLIGSRSLSLPLSVGKLPSRHGKLKSRYLKSAPKPCAHATMLRFKNVGKEDKSHQDKEYARERVQENMRAITNMILFRSSTFAHVYLAVWSPTPICASLYHMNISLILYRSICWPITCICISIFDLYLYLYHDFLFRICIKYT